MEETPAAVPETGDSAAEGETPPAPQEETSAEPPAETEEATEPLTTEIQPVETLADEPEALAQADLAVVDSSGEPLDMASQASANTLAAADPRFVYLGNTYRFYADPFVCAIGEPYCFDNKGADVIQDALNYIRDHGTIPTDRKVYVDSGTYAAAVLVDGSQLNMSTINGLIGEDTGLGNPIITGNVTITNLAGGFTRKGCEIMIKIALIIRE